MSSVSKTAMATCSSGGTHSPPPSAECQSPQQNSEFEVFDQVYYRRGKVFIFPDVRKAKVDFFKKVSPPQPAASPGGRNAHVATNRKQQGRQEGESFVLDKDKWKNPSRVREQEADDSEVLVIELIKTALEEVMEPDDPPVFLLHNQYLTSRTISATSGEQFKIDKNKGEMDILIFHPTLGILFVEVKSTKTVDFHTQQWEATESNDVFSPFNKATTQLIRNQTSILEEVGDLLENDAFVLTIALPNLKPQDASAIRKEAEERKRKKQTSDVTEGTRSTEEAAVMTSATGTADHAAIASPVCDSRPEKQLLQDHSEILLLCGSMREVFTKWVRHLRRLRDSAGHAFKGSTDQERLDNYKRACIRRLSVAGLTAGKSVKDSAALHHRFLLMEEQVKIRDSPARYLYIRGPPGSGKTLLLAERARRWIREGRRVALAVGHSFYTPLLHQLTRSVCGDKTDGARVSTHNDYRDLLEWLDTVSTADPVFVILDEALGVYYSSLLHHVTAGRVGGLWIAYTKDLDDKYKEAWQAAGGTTEQLQLCLRCPLSVVALSNTVRDEQDAPPLLPPPVPVTRELGVGVEVISHADHGQSQSYEECPTCREGVKNFFSSLGLPGDDVTSTLSLSDCIIITTGGYTDINRKRVVRWLGGLDLRAVAEDIDSSTPVLLPGQTPESRDQARKAAWRARVVSGTDMEGRPVLHVVNYAAFLGLERAVVVVWHQDREDEDEDRQGQRERDRDRRMDFHRYFWFRAATRCQGRLLLVAATPSPALSLLPASSPAASVGFPPGHRASMLSACSLLPCHSSVFCLAGFYSSVFFLFFGRHRR